MQDVAQVKDGGEVVSKPSFQFSVYSPVPYQAPASATANPPTSAKIPLSVRTRNGGAVARGGRGSNSGINDTDPKAAAIAGASAWPIDAEANRPSFSSEWTQAPGPSSPHWYQATVPGTVLTTLVDNKVYPDPLYGENNRPNIIPDTLANTAYWYRTEFTVPASYAGKQIWLNFDGINYFADVWVNGTKVGEIHGAFMRGNFNVASAVKAGEKAVVAVLIHPPVHPGDPWEKTVANERGPNGGGTSGQLARDGPTFVASLGWDWVPGIRDRQIGIWQKVTLSASGPVVLVDPYVTTDLPLPRTDSADISIETRAQNLTDAAQTGVVSGKFGDVAFQSAAITLQPHETQVVKLTPQTTPALHILNPRLWWPNGSGEPNLYPLHLSFDINRAPSDAKDMQIGIRKLAYFVDGSNNLTLVVNGVKIYAKGGDWGMDDAMKRISAERMDVLIRLHKEANYNIIRNWVGQSTSEEFFAACDRYGIMVWDEFFQANPANGRDPDDTALYLANVRDTVLRYRNHPCIVIWCGRNEGGPTPPAIAEGNIQILKELDPLRYYQASSTSGNGVISGGPYGWQLPESYYNGNGLTQAFKTEIGSASIPTLEAIQAWMPEKDWFDRNFPNDDWAEHDLVNGAGNPANSALQTVIAQRYGPYASLAEFVRKAQMADYETYRAMYESHLTRMFNPSTALITWMSNPAQPCLVWQIYDYSLEPFAAYFAVQKACEPVHIMMAQNNFHLMVINQTPQDLAGLQARTQIYNLDGTKKYDETHAVPSAAATSATDLGAVPFPEGLSPVHFVKLELLNAAGKVVSSNFYWHETNRDDLTALDSIPDVTLDAQAARHDRAGKVLLDVTLTNPTPQIAVMAHLQLRNARTNQRVLPVFYSDNYVSLLPGESKVITVEAPSAQLGADQPLVAVDGWNTTVNPTTITAGGGVSIAPNANALVVRAAKTAAN
jgi:beta-mannosidase